MRALRQGRRSDRRSLSNDRNAVVTVLAFLRIEYPR